jgi:23S rRNA (adenine2503-C2)-methyltransferase
LATVYIATDAKGRSIEFVESVQPPYSIAEKWVLIISTLYGCPVDCTFCDAGGSYSGIINFDELKFQIDYMVSQRFPDGLIDTDKFKIQFARMGEPAFNPNVLELLRIFPEIYNYRYFLPSLSTIAPKSSSKFFDELLDIKKSLYRDTFQLQFSLHTTDLQQRDRLMPVSKWSFNDIADYAGKFYDKGGKKVVLNFALTTDSIFNPDDLKNYFDPNIFLLKITPLNPTYKSAANGLQSLISENRNHPELIERIKDQGYDVILSIGEYEENKIGSNCGQYVTALKTCKSLPESYTYEIIPA